VVVDSVVRVAADEAVREAQAARISPT
jgi:hypothetical protein